MTVHKRFFVAFSLLLCRTAFCPPDPNQWSFEQPERVVAVGDIHANPIALKTILRDRGLIDESEKWIGGKAHLVLMGDLIHRGPNSIDVIDLVMKLEREAQTAGGHVHCLMGNHDLMVLGKTLEEIRLGELDRDGKYFSSVDERAGYGRYSNTSLALNLSKGGRKNTIWSAYIAAFNSNESDIAKWMRTRKAIVKIGDTIFVHAALGPWVVKTPPEKLNEALRLYVESEQEGGSPIPQRHPLSQAVHLVTGEALKSKDLARKKMDETEVHNILRSLQVQRIVLGHVVTKDLTVNPKYGGNVLLIDTGISYGFRSSGGKLSALELTMGKTPGVTLAKSYNDIGSDNSFVRLHQCRRIMKLVRPR